MKKFGSNFNNHFTVINETDKYFIFKCKNTGQSFKIYKSKIPPKNLVCKSCGDKVSIYANGDYYKEKYNKVLEEYLYNLRTKTDSNIEKKVYYYRTRAQIPYKDFYIKKCRARIDELNQKIYDTYLLKLSTNEKCYKDDSKNRNLFLVLKKAIPDFTEFERFCDYRDYIINQIKGDDNVND